MLTVTLRCSSRVASGTCRKYDDGIERRNHGTSERAVSSCAAVNSCISALAACTRAAVWDGGGDRERERGTAARADENVGDNPPARPRTERNTSPKT